MLFGITGDWATARTRAAKYEQILWAKSQEKGTLGGYQAKVDKKLSKMAALVREEQKKRHHQFERAMVALLTGKVQPSSSTGLQAVQNKINRWRATPAARRRTECRSMAQFLARCKHPLAKELFNCPEQARGALQEGDRTCLIAARFGGSEDAVPEAFVCSITQQVMLDPVVAGDGHTYERAAIQRWFAQGRSQLKSPLSGELFRTTKLLPNHNLRSQIQNFTTDNSTHGSAAEIAALECKVRDHQGHAQELELKLKLLVEAVGCSLPSHQN